MILKQRKHSGTRNPEIREYEIRHREIIRKTAADDIVLLKNEGNLLPLEKGSRIALYGAGSYQTIVGGTGSAAVHMREIVSVYQGISNAGFQVTTKEELKDAMQEYQEARAIYRQTVLDKVDANTSDLPLKRKYHIAYNSTPFFAPMGKEPQKTETDVALYVISRNGGEGQDRFCRPGDYELTEEENETLGKICSLYEHVIFVINSGGMIDLSFMDRYDNIHGLVYMHQPGMEAGNALADILTGDIPACGKLSDSWAYRYLDYPNSAFYSHNKEDMSRELYKEGIFVGYRYFDSYEIPVRYCFGFGLSYTEFEMSVTGIKGIDFGTENPKAEIKVRVKNTGNSDGKEVVQLYAACPQKKQPKEYRRLAGFAKTRLLHPGEEEEVTVVFPIYALASFYEMMPGWMLEKGKYGLFVGNSLENAMLEAIIELPEDIIAMRTEHICPLQEELKEMEAPVDKITARRAKWERSCSDKATLFVNPEDMTERMTDYENINRGISEQAKQFVDSLTLDQLIALANGEITSSSDEAIGDGGIYVPGSGGQTGTCAIENGLASIVFADGPAGLRLQQKYQIVDDRVVPITFEMKFADGFFSRAGEQTEGERWYQYCTAIPTGTTLAQTWNVEQLEECGKVVAEEMQEFGITVWLAPGMNVHRNPLCGRNFEYYSEDPLLSACMASAMTRGVESLEGCYTTLKHMACNNAEDNRMHSDSIVSERALREIYLRGYELAVLECHPAALMTSYNMINGIHAANNYDICNKVARGEWGFDGLFITDWVTTQQGPDCTASGCMRAGNDLVMPGSMKDQKNLREELDAGTLSQEELKRSVCRIVELIWKSDWCEPDC